MANIFKPIFKLLRTLKMVAIPVFMMLRIAIKALVESYVSIFPWRSSWIPKAVAFNMFWSVSLLLSYLQLEVVAKDCNKIIKKNVLPLP